MSLYYRPLPAPHGRHSLAGGWIRFSEIEVLERGRRPRISSDIPDEVLATLTAPRPDVAGLSMDRPRVMGIVNATPDSFSDGGRYEPVEQGMRLIAEAADMLDIGGESTRPGALAVQVPEEIARIRAPIRALSSRAPVSVDTRKAAVAQAALEAGAAMVNDVSGLDFDPALAGVVERSGVPICLMHAQGLPATMQDDPRYGDVLLDVYDALAARIGRAEAAGIPRRRIVVDPGIGFGKTQAHNLAILRRISLYHGLGCAILLGVSRKRFIGAIGGADEPQDRGPGTLAVTLAAVAQGAQIHRVHDAGGLAQALRLWQAVANNERANP